MLPEKTADPGGKGSRFRGRFLTAIGVEARELVSRVWAWDRTRSWEK